MKIKIKLNREPLHGSLLKKDLRSPKYNLKIVASKKVFKRIKTISLGEL